MLFSFFSKIFRKKIDIYTDGSHKGKWGSWAFVVVKNKKGFVTFMKSFEKSDLECSQFSDVRI